MRYLIALALVVISFSAATATAAPSISVTDQTYTCTTAVEAGTSITLNYTFNFPGQGFRIGRNCVGDGDPSTCDINLDVKGDGLTYGTQDDAIRILNYQRETSQGLVICGRADCGNRQGTNFHQDGMQQLGGNGITFKDFEIGDYDGKQATCQGAGGTIFYSLPGVDIDVIGGKFIGCNHSLFLSGDTSPGSEVRDASFRSGHAMDDPVCAPYFSSNACHISSEWGGQTSNLTCEEYPFEAPAPPPPPPPPPPDTTPPPYPIITSGPPQPKSYSTSATFEFEDAEQGVTFECSLDGAPLTACSSPASYTGLAAFQDHTFQVRALDAALNASQPASWAWKVCGAGPC